MVTVTVSGTYNFFFHQLLGWFGVSANLNNTPIIRQTRSPVGLLTLRVKSE
jgi:hypothetical protein